MVALSSDLTRWRLGCETNFGIRCALLGGYTAAVLAYSQLNLSNLTDMGVSVSLGDRFATFGHDLLSMAPTPAHFVALLLAFLFATLVLRWVPHLRTLGYVLGVWEC